MLACIAALALTSCDASPRTAGIRLDAGPDGADFGAAFPVSVTRTWREGIAAPPWDDAQLAPLDVKAAGITERTDAGRVIETRMFDAYAFRAGDVGVPAAKTSIRVKHAVDPAKPGDPELPGEPLAVPLPLWTKLAAAAAALVLVAWITRRLRAGPVPLAPAAAAPPPPPPRPDEVALAALAALRSAASVHRETAEILRVYVRDRFGVAAMERTTEELASDAAIPHAHVSRLSSLLGAADLVKFACAEPSAAERSRLLDDAESFVRTAGAPPA